MEQEIHLDVEELEERIAPTVIAIRQVRLRKTGPTIKLRGSRANMGRWMSRLHSDDSPSRIPLD